jgi:hypothetical protein
VLLSNILGIPLNSKFMEYPSRNRKIKIFLC